MLEKEMEDLIANYPDDFFPRKRLVLIERQKTFPGVGRFDLLFEDEFGTSILMELKARPAKYEDATQLARYRDVLLSRGHRNIIMWLVAPQISLSVRDFLDQVGIEYSEIHESEFRRIAERHGYVIGEAKTLPEQESISSEALHTQTGSPVARYTRYIHNRLPQRIKPEFRRRREQLKNAFEAAYLFLMYPESPETDIVLMTSTNAHLYFQRCFLAYIILGYDSITLSPRYNNRIHQNAIYHPSLLFQEKLPQLIEEHEGFKKRWARRHQIFDNFHRQVYEYTFRKDTPLEFFAELVEVIENLDCRE
ncbi:MAG: DUF91 domain-containing protein [Chloroflexi bacterium]|nr:DUF91 domain-containing protein [Chloroflexota bacterium]